MAASLSEVCQLKPRSDPGEIIQLPLDTSTEANFYLQDLNLDNLFIICSDHGDVVRIEWRVCDCEGMRSVQCRPPETNIHVTLTPSNTANTEYTVICS